MARHERRLIALTPENRRAAIPHNFRIVRTWTQEVAALWYGVSTRTWRRYEQRGAPPHVLHRIKSWATRTEIGAEHARWLY